ncbi:MAG: hypothetical protein ACON38_13225 [Akkermansiaceae bacterium]
MRRLLELFYIFVLQIFILFFVVLIPAAWMFRDGMGPESTPSSGMEAFHKAFMTFYVGPALVFLIPLAIFSGGFFKRKVH